MNKKITITPAVKKTKKTFAPFVLSLGLILTTFVGILVLGIWFYTGQLEESVQGLGQVMPEGYIKKVMSPASGEIIKIYVNENQTVKTGQPLFEIDPQLVKIEQNGVLNQLAILKQESNALNLAIKQEGKGSSLSSELAEATKQEFQSKIALANMQISKTSYQYKETVEKYNQTAKILSSSEKMLKQYEDLYKEGGLSEKDFKEYEQKVMEQRGNLATLDQELKARKIEYNQALIQPRNIVGGYKKDVLSKIKDYQRDIAQLTAQVQKNGFTGEHLIVRAPADGVVNEQAIHGTGEYVNTGQILLSIVPYNTKLIIEVKVANKDMSYIYSGQKVSLRMDAMPYQHFGKLYGTVINISPSTLQSKDGLPYYLARIKPEKTILKENTGKEYFLIPGMTVSADFITRRKKIYRFFIDPIQYQLDRAFRDPTTR